MKVHSQDSPIVKALLAAGVIPAQCLSFVLRAEVNHAIVIESKIFATPDQISAIAKALKDNPEEAKQLAQKIAFADHRSGVAAVEVEI